MGAPWAGEGERDRGVSVCTELECGRAELRGLPGSRGGRIRLTEGWVWGQLSLATLDGASSLGER